MGLDITAYRGLKPIKKRFKVLTEEEYEARIDKLYKNNVRFFNMDCFKDRGLNKEDGYFTYTDEFGFNAGSYGGYNRWRSMLSEIVLGVEADYVWKHTDQYNEKPFFYLIHFADNEGNIAGDIKKILQHDFETTDIGKLLNEYNASQSVKEDFIERYSKWKKAFTEYDVISFH